MSLSLSLGSFFGLEAGQIQGLQARGVQPNRADSNVSFYHSILLLIFPFDLNMLLFLYNYSLYFLTLILSNMVHIKPYSKGAIPSRWSLSSRAELQEPVSICLKAKSAYLAGWSFKSFLTLNSVELT